MRLSASQMLCRSPILLFSVMTLAGNGAGAIPAPIASSPSSMSNNAAIEPCTPVPGFPCEWSKRFDAVQKKINELPTTPGFIGVSLTDRNNSATWTAGDVSRPGWTASTVKLAIAADLRARGGLSQANQADMDAMLHSSDNDATDRLWAQYGGDDMLARFRDVFGMTSLAFQPGHTKETYWGFVKCSVADLATLGRYVLERTAPQDRKYLVDTMRSVADNQHWGVWAAGPDQQPGTKNGWSQEQDSWGQHWVTATVGFAGPDERYVASINYQMQSPGSLEDGVHAISDIIAMLFAQSVPAPVTLPDPDD